jgi:hypothetical protein
MSRLKMFSDELTEADKKSGFVLMVVKNPHARYMGQPESVKAVVLRLSITDRIIKLYETRNGMPGYQHQRYGRLEIVKDMPAEWTPLTSVVFHPQMEVDVVKSVTAEMSKGSKIIPVDPGDDF